MLCRERLGDMMLRLTINQLTVITVCFPLFECHIRIGWMTNNDDIRNLFFTVQIKGIIDDIFQPDPFGTSTRMGGGNDDFSATVIDTIGQCACRKPAKDHRMNGAQTSGGQHRVSRLRDHWHVNDDPITLFYPEFGQCIRQATDLFIQHLIRDVLRDLQVLALPDNRGFVFVLRQMTVNAIFRHI